MSPRILHVSCLLPAETHLSKPKLFIHGGEFEGKILTSFAIFDFDSLSWWKSDHESTDFVPQLKAHACTEMRDPVNKHQMIIISGGLYKEHMSHCEAKTNKQREKCFCYNEVISEQIYAFSNNQFREIHIVKDGFNQKFKRFGHNMVSSNDNCIYMICGFAQFMGYLVDIIKLTPKPDLKNKTFFFESKNIEIGKTMPGRMNATCKLIGENLILYGGLKDNRTLSDLWIVNLEQKFAQLVYVEPNWIYPRFGMSSIAYRNGQDLRFIIFGGSYWGGKNLVYGMTNEILVFNFKYRESEGDYEIIKILPLVYGKAARRIFHQTFCYENKMYCWGGPDNMFLKLSLPVGDQDEDDLKNKISLNDYLSIRKHKITIDPRKHFTQLIVSQEDDESQFNESSNRSSRRNQSKIEESLSNLNVSVNELNNSNMELISLKKKDDKSEQSLGYITSNHSINSKGNLIDNKKKKKREKPNTWDKDYK